VSGGRTTAIGRPERSAGPTPSVRIELARRIRREVAEIADFRPVEDERRPVGGEDSETGEDQERG
jgi:hypothetical protein